MLAIHLNREIHEAGFKPNKQNHVVPILATALKESVNRPATGQNGSKPDKVSALSSWCTEYTPGGPNTLRVT